MRNRALHDQLRAFAERVAEHLAAALESGAEIPFEVSENPGATSVLYRYRPLSGQFLAERFAELRALEGFGPAVLALTRVEGVSAYLRVLGVSYVPASERDRAEAVLREFLGRVWEEATAFEVEDARFERAYRELESIVYENTVVNTVLAPLLGIRLAAERWDLGSGIALVRGDLCDAPPEAVWAAGREEREANTLALLTVEATPQDPPPLTAARLAFRKLLTALRLFKPGSATLGTTAWWRMDDGPWQSLPLGFAGHPRTGDYWLEPAEQEELAELFEVTRSRPLRGGALPWALARFEMGCEQPIAIEGLSDHLLAVRALLDGEDASPAGIPSRLAVLCAEAADREELEASAKQAFKLERLVMRGNLDADYLEAIGSDPPEQVARDLEENLRAILRDIVCGYLDSDVKRTADELLMAEAPQQAPRATAPPAQPRPASPPPRRKEPRLESWEEVVPAQASQPAPAEPPEPEFVVRRKSRITKRDPVTRRRYRESPTDEQASVKADDGPATEETVAVGGVREIEPEQDDLDWGFDDDPSDYSAAV